MKISAARLKKLIKEELFYREFYRGRTINEAPRDPGPPPDMNAPGWGPNDSEDWERNARYAEREEIDAEKQAFMKSELIRWYDEFDPADDGQADLIEDKLSECYDAIYKELIDPYGDY